MMMMIMLNTEYSASLYILYMLYKDVLTLNNWFLKFSHCFSFAFMI